MAHTITITIDGETMVDSLPSTTPTPSENARARQPVQGGD